MQAVVSSVLHLPLFVDGSPWLLSVEHEVAIVSVNVLTGPFNKFTLGFWGSGSWFSQLSARGGERGASQLLALPVMILGSTLHVYCLEAICLSRTDRLASVAYLCLEHISQSLKER